MNNESPEIGGRFEFHQKLLYRSCENPLFTLRVGRRANGFRRAASFDIVHRKVMSPIVLANFVHRNNVGVIQLAGCTSLAIRPLNIARIGEPPRKNHLESNDAIQFLLASFEDDAYAPRVISLRISYSPK